MLMRLQPYDLKIVYQPGAEMCISDALSRLSDEDQDEIADLDVTSHKISSHFTSSLLEEIRTATDEDNELRSLKEIIYVGWPQSRSDVHRVLLQYWNFRDELSIDNGIVTKGTRIVIPRKINSLKNSGAASSCSSRRGEDSTSCTYRRLLAWDL